MIMFNNCLVEFLKTYQSPVTSQYGLASAHHWTADFLLCGFSSTTSPNQLLFGGEEHSCNSAVLLDPRTHIRQLTLMGLSRRNAKRRIPIHHWPWAAGLGTSPSLVPARVWVAMRGTGEERTVETGRPGPSLMCGRSSGCGEPGQVWENVFRMPVDDRFYFKRFSFKTQEKTEFKGKLTFILLCDNSKVAVTSSVQNVAYAYSACFRKPSKMG